MADPRENAQVDLILDRLRDQVAGHPAGWRDADGTIDFLYRPGTVLTRSADADEVIEALSALGAEPVREEPPAGDARAADGDVPDSQRLRSPARPDVTALTVEVPARYVEAGTGLIGLLDDVAERIGPGRARPEHLVYVCGHPCPATEPEETGDPGPTAWPCEGSASSGEGVFALIVDTGLDLPTQAATAWLAGVTGEQDPAVGGGTIGPYGGHGTFVAGCARTVAPDLGIHVSNALIPAIGAEFERTVAARIEAALDRLVARRAPDILVYTFATRTYGDVGLIAFDELYERRLSRIKGLAVLAPAGNDGWSKPMYPGAYPWVGAVGALDAARTQRAHYSNRGPWVDVWAPGTDLVNALGTGTYTCTEPPFGGEQRTFTGLARWSGTSFSTPTVAGMVAARAGAKSMSARAAWHELLVEARAGAVPGVGPVLLP